MIRETTTNVHHANVATGAADANAWASTFDEITYKDKHAVINEAQAHNPSKGANFLFL